MFDFLFDNGVIFIAIAIFIGRLILQFRRKGREEGEKPPSRAPHFFEEPEEEEDEAEESGRRIAYTQTRGSSDFLRELVMREAAREAAPQPPPPKPEIRPAVPQLAPAAPVKPAGRPSGEESHLPRGRAFPASLNRLSPMRQAVILAEILGPPKGL